MHTPIHRLTAVATLAACAVLGAGTATANVLTAEQLNIYRDGSSADWLQGNSRLLGDAFDNDNPFVGPAFTSTGTAANYQLLGATSASAVREQNNQLLLDPNLGQVAANAQGNTGTSVRLRLMTNTTDTNGGLNIGRSFAATLRLSLSAAPDPGQTFGLRLNDGGISAVNNDVVELFWAGNASGGNIVFRKQDFEAGTIDILGSAPLLAPAGAAMLVLSLTHNTPGSAVVNGSYNFADASGQLLSTTFSGFNRSATAFTGEDFTRVELRASGVSAPVPEPGTWALMAAGLGVLLRRRARRPG